MTMTLTLHVMGPKRTLWNSQVEELVLTTTTGQIGILPNHASLITVLSPGLMKMRIHGQWASVSLMRGFAQLDSGQITILLMEEVGEAGELEFEQALQLLRSAEMPLTATTTRQ